MKKVKVVLMMVVLIAVTCILNVPAQAAPGWNLVFSDDFNGSAIDGNNWFLYDCEGHNNNGLRKPSAVSIAGGQAVITAQMAGGTLISGAIGHKTNLIYGKFEFRVKMDQDPSGVTSGVVLTWPQSNVWPGDGENDIYETGTNAARDSFSTFVHYDATNKQHTYKHNVDATQWHTVALEWEPDVIRTYVDGVLDWELYDAAAIPDVAHHLCIQLDAFASTMTGSTKMYVDWVKIYQGTSNQAVNPRFETGDKSGWSGWGTWSVVNSNQYEGSYAAQVNKNAAAEQVVNNLLPNTTYVLRAKVKSATTADKAYLGVRSYGGNEKNTVITDTGYQDYSVMFTTGASNTSATIYLYRDTSGSSYAYGDSFVVSRALNSVANAGLETGTKDGWSGWGTWAAINNNQAEGAYCAQVSKNAAAEQVIKGLTPNTTYILKAKVKSATTDDKAYLGVRNYGGTEKNVSISETAYKEYTVTFTTGATNTTATIYLYRDTTGSSYAYGDSFEVRK